jgi:protocatechuate 3,4-dioxygenase beta subunit
MIITLIVISLLLGGYSLYLIKKHKEDTHLHFILFGHRIDELKKKTLYLLDENEESLLKKLKEINNQNQKDNDIKHEQLISNEFKKLKSDIDKDLNDIVESVKNIKVF